MSEKLSRKELKGPDAFQRSGQEARAWMQERRRPLTILIVVGLLGLGGVALGSYVSGKGEAEAAKELGGELKIISRPVDGSPAAAEALPDAKEPPFKSEKEKDEAIAKALTDFRGSHHGTHASASAALPLAQALYRLERYDDALGAYEDYLKIVPPDDPLRALALEGKGYCLEGKGQLDAALGVFEEMSREGRTDFMNGMGLYHRARVLIEQGKKDEAAKQLAEISVNAPNTAAARMAAERMSVLASQGVVIPTVAKPVVPDAGV